MVHTPPRSGPLQTPPHLHRFPSALLCSPSASLRSLFSPRSRLTGGAGCGVLPAARIVARPSSSVPWHKTTHRRRPWLRPGFCYASAAAASDGRLRRRGGAVRERIQSCMPHDAVPSPVLAELDGEPWPAASSHACGGAPVAQERRSPISAIETDPYRESPRSSSGPARPQSAGPLGGSPAWRARRPSARRVLHAGCCDQYHRHHADRRCESDRVVR
jgi:hypothetical protein